MNGLKLHALHDTEMVQGICKAVHACYYVPGSPHILEPARQRRRGARWCHQCTSSHMCTRQRLCLIEDVPAINRKHTWTKDHKTMFEPQ